MNLTLPVELFTNDIPRTYSSFADLVGEEHWRRRAKALRDEIRGNRFLSEYLLRENAVVFALDHCATLAHRRAPLSSVIGDPDVYSAIAFAAQATSMIANSPPNVSKSFIGRIRGAINDSEIMRAVCLELLVATHFVKRGYPIEWPELSGSGRVDLVLPTLGASGLEVECKAMSQNKGRKVHRRGALTLNNLVKTEIKPVTRTLKAGLALVLTVPDRLPTTPRELKELAVRVKRQIVAGQSETFSDGVSIRLTQFDARSELTFDRDGNPEFDHDKVDRLTSTNNREAMITVDAKGTGAVIFVVQSEREDSPLRALHTALKSASNDQLDKSKPGLLIVGIDSLNEHELMALSAQDRLPSESPTGLRIMASRFLSSKERKHVIGVSFLSAGALTRQAPGIVRGGGAAYLFPHTESDHWHSDFDDLFAERPPSSTT